METIISACISAGAALIVCLISNHAQKKEINRKHQEEVNLHHETVALMEYKLDELTKRVEKHNNTVERTYHLEEQVALQEEKIKVANHRIEDLERKVE